MSNFFDNEGYICITFFSMRIGRLTIEMQRFADPGAFRVTECNGCERGSEDSRSRAREGRKEPAIRRAAGLALVPRAFAKHAGRRTHAASCRDEADDLENLACEWRGDARTMRGISVLNFARRSWQRVTRPRPLLDVVPRVAMTFGFDFEWSLEWSVSLSHLPIRDWDLIYVAPPPKFSATPPRHCRMPTWIRRWWWVPCYEYHVSSNARIVCLYMRSILNSPNAVLSDFF